MMPSQDSAHRETIPRMLLVAGGGTVIAAVMLWAITACDDGNLPERSGVTARATPTAGKASADEDRALADMTALGYVVDEEVETPSATPSTGTGNERVAARRFQNLAVSFEDSGDLEAAEEAFRSAIAADPTYRPPHYSLAGLLRRTGRFDEADREFWIAVDNGLIDPPRAIVRVATQYRNLGKIKRAGRILDEGRRRFPDSADIWLHFGAFFGEIGDYERSALALERAISLAPDDPLGYRNLAAAQVALGNRDEALCTLEEGLRRDPTSQEIKQMLAELEGTEGQ